jgi:choline kinase
MAAGMGSRYGGLKQIDPVGSCGEAILDYSLFDAHEAGFETAVIIIKKAIEKDFMETVGARLKNCPLQIRYAYQEIEKEVPQDFEIPAQRKKPWGTSHAVLCAKNEMGDAPFAVLNADDYYGKSAFREIYKYLSNARDGEKYDYCMVGYQLGKTVTDNGSVARGICQVDENSYLTAVVERTQIEKYPGGIHFTTDGGATWGDFRIDPFLVEQKMMGCNASLLRVERAELGAQANLLPEGCDAVTVFANPFSEKREHVSATVSFDDGKTWSVVRRVHTGPSGYSSLAYCAADGCFYLLYELGEDDPCDLGLNIAVFDLAWLLEK